MRSARACLLVIGLTLGAPWLSRAAWAAPTSSADSARAVSLYEEGNRLLQSGEPRRSLAPLEESMRLLPSPNTELLIGHALRQLGDNVGALEKYAHVRASAKERVAAGEARFSPTANDAQRWLASLTPSVADLTVNVSNAPDTARLFVNGRAIAWLAGSSGAVRAARSFAEPGLAKIELRLDERVLAQMEAPLAKGSARLVTLEIAGAPQAHKEPVPPAQATSGGVPAPPLAAWVAGGIGAAGMISFAVAGGIALANANELDECAPRCDSGDPDTQDARDTGKTAALVANVSAAVGGAGLVTGALLWIFWPRPDVPNASEPTPSVSLDVGPASFDLRVRF